MENKGLLFIPDISGFTRFVNQTDIEHSSLIIQELLEVLINSNDTGLVVSEVEGDAILFYKFGECPPLETVYKQVQKMFCDFHKRLTIYDSHRFCQCDACNTAKDLTLKVITHYGEFTGYTVKNFSKLIGKDVIVAHQLLKNDIEQHEYWLVTDNILQSDAAPGLAAWMKWDRSHKATENGDISFHYTHLGELKNEIEPEPPVQLEIDKKVKVLSVSKEFDAEIIHLFHATGDFRYRHQWQEGVKEVQEVSHFLPRVGMRYKRIGDKERSYFYASSYSFDPEHIEFSETDEKKRAATHFTLEKTGENKTKLTVDYFLRKNIMAPALFNLFEKRKMQESFERSLDNLQRLVKEIKLPGEN